MKPYAAVIIGALLLAACAAAADIDGQWVSEFKMPAARRAGGGERTVQVVFDLKADGSKLTGSVGGAGRRRAKNEIQEGRIEGDRFSFVTMQKTRDRGRRIVWQGLVENGELKGTRGRENAKRTVEFTARRKAA